jgi:hypothetical protein
VTVRHNGVMICWLRASWGLGMHDANEEILRELRELRLAVERLTHDFQTSGVLARAPDNFISAVLAFVAIGCVGFIGVGVILELGSRFLHWWS